jgi:hypothetical protein
MFLELRFMVTRPSADARFWTPRYIACQVLFAALVTLLWHYLNTRLPALP